MPVDYTGYSQLRDVLDSNRSAGEAAFDKRSAKELRIVAEVLEQGIAIQDGTTEQLPAPSEERER
ncbi:hypothetical protein [Sphingomonas sp. 67-41]|uniref:hypothetical protein n=1 Tax=Sphingomonas TaxID=13687 RepID=UPI000967BA56|nr:hypothetical protein [Sphingomonas sp. 67-41]OJY51473.1 MAG: hypothetical protein BGP17_13670 [Sphingomonas sp. 67-41]